MLIAQTIVKVYPTFHPIVRATLHGEGYEFGWSFWVALGTILLASFTATLAWHTSRLAKETKQLAVETTDLAKRTSEEVASQFRPVLVPDSDVERTVPVVQVFTNGLVRFHLRNSGNGPALGNGAQAGGVTAQPWDYGALPPGKVALLHFNDVQEPANGFDIRFTCDDLNLTRYGTTIQIRFWGERHRVMGVFYDQLKRVRCHSRRVTSM